MLLLEIFSSVNTATLVTKIPFLKDVIGWKDESIWCLFIYFPVIQSSLVLLIYLDIPLLEDIIVQLAEDNPVSCKDCIPLTSTVGDNSRVVIVVAFDKVQRLSGGLPALDAKPRTHHGLYALGQAVQQNLYASNRKKVGLSFAAQIMIPHHK